MTRARDLGITIGTGKPGANNAITDVPGVRVGHTTLIRGEGPLRVGEGPVRTGVTVVLPHGGNVWNEPRFAGCHRLNGNGEMTGLEWVRESGMLMSPLAITNTASVGIVRDTLVEVAYRDYGRDDAWFALPVVAETYDGRLNDINGHHLKPEHLWGALRAASDGPVPEGNVGGGTGMICHGFKGGIGTASRVLPEGAGGYAVGVLVQANHGTRSRLQIAGVPVGELISPEEVPLPGVPPAGDLRERSGGTTGHGMEARGGRAPGAENERLAEGAGSIIVVVATDAPLLPLQCDRLAQRAALGIARTGGAGEHFSGDLIIAFATGNRTIPGDFSPDLPLTVPIEMLANPRMTPLFHAVIEATEEAIVNALVAAEPMTGRDGFTVHRLPHERLVEVMRAHGGARNPR